MFFTKKKRQEPPCGSDDHYYWVDDNWPCPACHIKSKREGIIRALQDRDSFAELVAKKVVAHLENKTPNANSASDAFKSKSV